MLMLDLLVPSRIAGERRTVRNWHRADWESIKRGLEEVEWPTTNDQVTAEATWQLLRGELDRLLEEHVPMCDLRPRKSDWMTGEILREVRRKRRLWKAVKGGTGRQAYEEAARKVKNMIRSAKRGLEKRLAREKSGNSKPFYNYVKKKTTAKSTIGPLRKSDGRPVTEEADMAAELNNYFASVFTQEDCQNLPEPPRMNMRNKLQKPQITTAKVRAAIKKLKPHSAAGPDGIGPKILQTCTEQLAPVLAMIFRKSINQGMVPEEWRQANVVPIFKKGSKADPGNYRPVSLTCISCKLLEGILKEDIMAHLGRNRLINASQHGFMKNKSCATNLLEFVEKITEAADGGKSIDVIYLDFAKAFDKVPTERLLKKMAAHGIEGTTGRWIAAWLKNRTQWVTINGKKSGCRAVLSGVPQGSVLGPVLFLLFINDLDEKATKGQIFKKFADDTKVAQILDGPNSRAELQNTLDRLCEWAETWGMSFNVAKCHVMHIGKNNPQHQYRMDGVVLKETEEERDIGITVTSNLKPAKQCLKAAATATSVLMQILKSFHYRDRHLYMNLYKQYVRPHLEFAVTAWSPWNRADIDCLEKVQMKAVKAVSGLKGKEYEERLTELGLPSLSERRAEMDMVQTYKIVNGVDDVRSEVWFRRADTRRPTRTTTGRDMLLKHRSAHEFRRNFFSQRVVDPWNELPDELKEATSVASFKRLLRRHVGKVVPAAAGT